MGLVQVAEDLALGRLAALKVLAPFLVQDPEISARFRFEARNQERPAPANITMVYAFLVEDEQAFVVLEFIVRIGRPLSVILRERSNRSIS